MLHNECCVGYWKAGRTIHHKGVENEQTGCGRCGCYALISWLCGPRAFFALLAVLFFIVPRLFAFSYPSVKAFIGRWIFVRRLSYLKYL